MHKAPYAPGFKWYFAVSLAAGAAAEGRTPSNNADRAMPLRLDHMTLLAAPRGERPMDLGLEELRVLRGVGVVATNAVHRRRVDAQVRFRERDVLHVVAARAEGLLALREQPHLAAVVGLMAGGALAGRGGVRGFRPQLFSDARMAAHAEVRLLRQKQLGELGLVR